MKNYKKGFTLSETMIVLVVLGLVVAITVPNVFRRYQESLARTKIKKSMTIYDMFISKSAIDNDFRSENEFNNWAKADGCKNARRFFDVIKEDGCRFVTKDKVHWDFTEPLKPVIALNDDAWDSYLESGKTDGKWSFGFVVTYDPKTGSFRVNDLAYEINRLKEELLLADEDSKSDIQAKIDELEKLYGFMNNEIGTKIPSTGFNISNTDWDCYNESDDLNPCYICDIDVTINKDSYNMDIGSGVSFSYHGGNSIQYVGNRDCHATIDEAKQSTMNKNNLQHDYGSIPNDVGGADIYECNFSPKSVSCSLYGQEGYMQNGLKYNCIDVMSDIPTCVVTGNATVNVPLIGDVNLSCSEDGYCDFEKQLDNGLLVYGGFDPATPFTPDTYYHFGASTSTVLVDCDNDFCDVESFETEEIHSNCDIIQRKCADGYKF